jgi:hypothetical protein
MHAEEPELFPQKSNRCKITTEDLTSIAVKPNRFLHIRQIREVKQLSAKTLGLRDHYEASPTPNNHQLKHVIQMKIISNTLANTCQMIQRESHRSHDVQSLSAVMGIVYIVYNEILNSVAPL